MKSQFGIRLFRLMLLFSAIPALILAAVGLYLATATANLTGKATRSADLALVERNRDEVVTTLCSGLTKLAADTTGEIWWADFAFSRRGDTIHQLKATSAVSIEQLGQLPLTAESLQVHMLELSGGVATVAVKAIGNNHWLGAGRVLGADYVALTQSALRDDAASQLLHEQRSYIAAFVALIFALTIGVAIGVAYTLSRRLAGRVARPVVALSEAAADLAGGNFDRRVDVKAEGELGTLVMAFNDMAQRLQRMTRQLAQTERVAAWQNVARRFAHELRNPLQPIGISLYRIQQQLKSRPPEPALEEALRAAGEEVEHLKELSDRFSRLAKLPEPVLERTELNSLLTSFADLYRAQLSERDFRLELATGPVHARIDKVYFREALHNLLQNSIEATEAGDRITLRLECTEAEATITVQDSGSGMSEETAATARLPYFTTKERGSGIGLAVVEKVVTECGGQLLVKSQVGVGTAAAVVLPREDSNHA